MKRALVVTSVASMVDQFLLPSIQLLKDMDFEVCVACNFEKGSTCSKERIAELRKKLSEGNVSCFQVDFERNITKISENICAYKELRKILSGNNYSLVHCHSPIGGIITRFACREIRKNGTKVFYTAHGFHFYKDAPLKNWLLYYPVEKLCSRFTDVLITINREDYALAQKKMRAKCVEYVPGVGIDLIKFGQTTVDKSAKRKELDIPENVTLLLSVGELNKNKNHETVIRAIKDLDVYYIIAGKGGLHEHLQNVIDELDLAGRVKLLGFRRDVAELYQTADVYVLPSIREGLNVSVMEAMASALPVVCSRIRGNTDLIDENGGVLFDSHSIAECEKAIESVLGRNIVQLGQYNLKKVQKMSFENVNEQMKHFYVEQCNIKL